MKQQNTWSRRNFFKAIAAASSVIIGPRAVDAEEAPLLSESDPAATAVHYVSDVSRAKDAKPGSRCANCSLYSGDSKSTQAVCALFNKKQVAANGWCSAWTDM